ncbi:MAG: sigma-70 family RNA polymerase sigma factor [Bacteroidales bacterium]|nr:sigma-70 family RNA polymerase sigma factor [Bacteroidales bacterium]
MKYHDDSVYIEQILDGNSQAYAYLVNKHKDMAYTIAIKIVKNAEDAEEIAQDAFVKAYRSLGSFRKKSKFSTWLYRIVYNTAISKVRKKQIEFAPVDDYITDNYSEDEINPDVNKLSDEEQETLVNKALDVLPEEESLLITMFYKNDNSIDEISEITGLSVSNVKVKLHRIRKKLHDEIEMLFQNKFSYR